MGSENLPTGNEPEYPREIYEPVLSPSVELDSYLKQELTISYFNTDGDHEMQTCYGDLKLTVDALTDYTHMLDTVCKQWNLKGFHRASYEYHADRLRKFAEKIQAAIGYDYAATLEKCRKKQKKQRNDDIGEDGITLLARHRKATAKENPRETESPDVSSEGNDPSVAEEGTASLVDDLPHSAGEEIPSPAENAADSEEEDFKLDIKKIEGGTPMEKNELRTALEGHLDTLKRNLAVVSLEELKTKYKKPFEELQHNISITATAYVLPLKKLAFITLLHLIAFTAEPSAHAVIGKIDHAVTAVQVSDMHSLHWRLIFPGVHVHHKIHAVIHPPYHPNPFLPA